MLRQRLDLDRRCGGDEVDRERGCQRRLRIWQCTIVLSWLDLRQAFRCSGSGHRGHKLKQLVVGVASAAVEIGLQGICDLSTVGKTPLRAAGQHSLGRIVQFLGAVRMAQEQQIHRVFEDSFGGLGLAVCSKERLLSEELPENDSQAELVAVGIVGFAPDLLWRCIAAFCGGLVAAELRQPAPGRGGGQFGDLNRPIKAYYDVFWADRTVNEADALTLAVN